MEFSQTEEQRAVAELARKIFEDARGDVWNNLAGAGLLGTAIPEDAGGSGHGLLELCALLVEAGGAAAREPLWSTLVLGALPIAELGTTEQQQRLLPGVAAGTLRLTAALADGAPVQAQPNGSGWALTGTVRHVPDAQAAARVLVAARTGVDSERVFLVDPNAAGAALTPQTTTAGDTEYDLALSGVRVAPDDVLGDRRDGGEITAWLLPRATVALCAMELGVCERVLRMTAEYTSQRRQFDRPIATFQAVSQRAADAYIDVEAIRLSMWEAAWRLAEGRPSALAVSIAKYWASDAGRRVVYAAQHLHGGIGFDMDYPLGKYYLRSKQIELTLGGASQHLARIGAALAG